MRNDQTDADEYTTAPEFIMDQRNCTEYISNGAFNAWEISLYCLIVGKVNGRQLVAMKIKWNSQFFTLSISLASFVERAYQPPKLKECIDLLSTAMNLGHRKFGSKTFAAGRCERNYQRLMMVRILIQSWLAALTFSLLNRRTELPRLFKIILGWRIFDRVPSKAKILTIAKSLRAAIFPDCSCEKQVRYCSRYWNTVNCTCSGSACTY